MNTNMLVTIDENTLDQVAGGGGCVLGLVGEIVQTAECVVGGVVEAGAGLVCDVVEAKVSFAKKLFGAFGC